MALADPLPLNVFADRLPVETVKWRLRRSDELSGLGGGQILASELAPPLWAGEVSLGAVYHDAAAQLQALVETLDGSLRSFYLYAPQLPYPQADPTGALLGAATPTIHTLDANNKAMRLTGLPAGYELTHGDFLAFDYGTPPRRAFHRIVEDATAGGTGITPLFEVRPHLRTGVATGLAVTLMKPAAKVFIMPDSFDPGEARGMVTTGMSFQVMQRL